ncbi:hypothetical protein RFF05_12850 [Bengtsoniella intestinalis]|uniref:hypothetical protein n=1 Tax=Bengtsoniella intestinalis TaxID=3073143 RepID=UPI00391F53F4
MQKKLYVLCLMIVLCGGLVGCADSSIEADFNTDTTERNDSTIAADNFYETAITEYLAAKEFVEGENIKLDIAISDAEELVQSDRSVLDNACILTLQKTILDAKATKFVVEEMPDETDDILLAIDALNAVNYSDIIGNLVGHSENLQESQMQFALVDAPSEEYIIACLEEVPSIIAIESVTEFNDQNGMLNTDGGYTAQIFFASDFVNQTLVKGTSAIEKGTAGGGSIEVYATQEDALNRNAYLEELDDTSLDTGSHTVIGTVLVRTSKTLNAEQQEELEQFIITALTDLDGAVTS